MNMKILKNKYILPFFKLPHVYLGYHIDSLANEWNYTVGDDHPVNADLLSSQKTIWYSIIWAVSQKWQFLKLA